MQDKHFLAYLVATRSIAALVAVCAAPAATQLGSGPVLFEQYGTPGDQQGFAVAGGHDFDLDGYDDLVVGAPLRDTGGKTDNGRVRLLSGRDGSLLFNRVGATDGDQLGWAVDVGYDVNADGWPDILAGAPTGSPTGALGAGTPGYARVLSGRDGSTLHTFFGDRSGDRFGHAVAFIDWDGDAYLDVAVGVPLGGDATGSGAYGQVRVYSGANGSALWKHAYPVDGSRFGEALAVGDVDGDGRADLIVGTPGEQAVEVVSGLTHQQLIVPLTGPFSFGEAVGAADLDGDGRAEVLVGAPEHNHAGVIDAGLVRAFDGLTGALELELFGEAAFDRIGCSFAGVADLDGDGLDELAFGAPELRPQGHGSVRVHSPGTGLELFRVEGPAAGSAYGSALAEGASFDPDHVPSLIIGAHLAGPPTAAPDESGLVQVVSVDCIQPMTYCTAGTSASGCQALISSTGTPSATASSGFTLRVSGAEGDKSGLFFFGASGRQANPWGSGTSFQCVVPPVKRAGLLPKQGTAGQCDGGFDQDLNALWCPSCPKPNHSFGAGARVQAQLWYRDPLNTSNRTTSLSNAIEFVLCP